MEREEDMGEGIIRSLELAKTEEFQVPNIKPAPVVEVEAKEWSLPPSLGFPSTCIHRYVDQVWTDECQGQGRRVSRQETE